MQATAAIEALLSRLAACVDDVVERARSGAELREGEAEGMCAALEELLVASELLLSALRIMRGPLRRILSTDDSFPMVGGSSTTMVLLGSFFFGSFLGAAGLSSESPLAPAALLWVLTMSGLLKASPFLALA